MRNFASNGKGNANAIKHILQKEKKKEEEKEIKKLKKGGKKMDRVKLQKSIIRFEVCRIENHPKVLSKKPIHLLVEVYKLS